MKITLLTLLSVFVLTHLQAQKIEVSVQANSSLFHYAGKSSTATSFINAGYAPAPDYTNNPYGSKNGFGYGSVIQAQLASKSGILLGVQAGYEVLRSKVDITAYYPAVVYQFGPAIDNQAPLSATGHTSLQNKSILINPFFGYRLNIKNVKVDLMPGIDFDFNVNSYDKGTVKDANGVTHHINDKRPNAPTDTRFRFGAAALYRKFGFTASYAHGLTNYNNGASGNTNYSVHSEVIRFGIAYRIFSLN